MSTLHRELCEIVSALQVYEHYIVGSPFPIYLYCDHKPRGTKKTTITSLSPLPCDHYKNPKLEDHLDARPELSLSRYSQQKYHDLRTSEASIAT